MTNPLRTNTKPKYGIINWSALPTTGCQLDNRPAETMGTNSMVVVRFALIGMFCLMLQGGLLWLQLGDLVGSISFFEMLSVGMCFALLQFVRRFARPRALKPSTAAFFALGFTVLLWLGLNSFYLLISSKTALIGLILIGFPLIGYWIDQTTTFSLFWNTAHPSMTSEQLSHGRAAWNNRWSIIFRCSTTTDRMCQQVAGAYLDGWFRFMMCWLVPLGAGLYLPSLTGMQLLGLLSLALLMTAFYQLVRFSGSLSPVLHVLNLNWTYGIHQRLVPWQFTSPTGPWWQRQLLTTIILVLLSFLLTHLSWRSIITSDLLFSFAPSSHFSAKFHQLLINGFACSLFLALMPMIIMVSSLIVLTGPILQFYHHKYEVFSTDSQQGLLSSSEACHSRLKNSTNRIEQRSLMQGVHPPTQIPILLDGDLLFEHMHILGATGIGKTTLGLTPLVIQLIRKDDGPVMVLDCKGDSAYFQTVKLEAERAGRTFKWFTNRPHHSTYVFNPFQQKHLEKLSLQEILGLLIQSLNLHHGDDYGRAWFTISSRMLLKAAFLKTMPSESDSSKASFGPIESFQDLHEIIKMLAQDDEKQYQAAQHLQFLVESLSQFEQLNLSPSRSPNRGALEQAIHMPDVIKNNEVIYFNLVGALDLSSVAEIARLALFSALAACIAHREETGQRPRFYCVIDEAQTVIAQNIQMVLAQAREHGMACILSHQTMSQLNPPGSVDLRELVMSCTSVKQYFSARDPFLKQYISDSSGQVPYYSASWDQLKQRTLKDEYGPQFASGNDQTGRPIRISESVGPRLTSEDIEDVSRHPNQSILLVERNSGFSCFHGAFPVQTDWPFTKAEHERRNFDLTWPAQSDATLNVTSSWPAIPVGTIAPQSHPEISDDDQQKLTQQRLAELREQLQKNKKKKKGQSL